MDTEGHWGCGCWDCATDRRNTIRLAAGLVTLLALLGGLFVAFAAQGSLEPGPLLVQRDDDRQASLVR